MSLASRFVLRVPPCVRTSGNWFGVNSLRLFKKINKKHYNFTLRVTCVMIRVPPIAQLRAKVTACSYNIDMIYSMNAVEAPRVKQRTGMELERIRYPLGASPKRDISSSLTVQ